MNRLKEFGLLCKLITLSSAKPFLNKDYVTQEVADIIIKLYSYNPSGATILAKAFLENIKRTKGAAAGSYYQTLLVTTSDIKVKQYARAILNVLEVSDGRGPKY